MRGAGGLQLNMTFIEIIMLLVLMVLILWALRPLQRKLEQSYLKFFKKFSRAQPRDRIYVVDSHRDPPPDHQPRKDH